MKSRKRIAAAVALLATLGSAVALPSSASAVTKPTGDPIKVGVIYTEGIPGFVNGEPRFAAQAGISYLNSRAGGIGGRPVQGVYCNDRNDPALDSQCARQFVDANVVAVIGQ